jgi:hypothetical protein
MTPALPMSSRIYDRLLSLYPDDLRRDHGAEMALLFADDLDAARREEGLHGVIRVWRYAIAEFFRLALPGLLASPAVRVSLIALAVFIAAAFGRVVVARHHTSILGVALFLPSLATPAVALLVVWSCRESSAVPLSLSASEHQPCSKSAI